MNYEGKAMFLAQSLVWPCLGIFSLGTGHGGMVWTTGPLRCPSCGGHARTMLFD
jgi:hypothetical protein